MRVFRPEDVLVRAPQVPTAALDGQTVLMSIDTGAYYPLEGPARTIWEKLQTPLTFSALVDALVEEYDVAPEACAADTQRYLGTMEEEGLLRVE